MNREKQMLLEKMQKYEKGILESKDYSNQEIQEKINFFKNLHPIKSVEEGRISNKRWLYEIKINTELRVTFKDCPDWSFTKLEYISKYGL